MERLIQLHKEMKHLCMLAHISEKAYDSILGKPELLPQLELFYAGAFTEAKKIRDLLPERIWTMYVQMGQNKLREQVLLRQSLTVMRTVFNSMVPNENKAKAIQEASE